jgi:hypothetical protein
MRWIVANLTARIAQPAQRVEGHKAAYVPADDDVRSFRAASTRVKQRGGVSCGPSRMTSRLPCTRIAGPVQLTTTTPFLMMV